MIILCFVVVGTANRRTTKCRKDKRSFNGGEVTRFTQPSDCCSARTRSRYPDHCSDVKVRWASTFYEYILKTLFLGKEGSLQYYSEL